MQDSQRNNMVADFAEATCNDPAKSEFLRGRLCWDAAFELLVKSGAITSVEKIGLNNLVDGGNVKFVQGAHQVKDQGEFINIPRGKLLAFVRQPYTAGGPEAVSHVVISLGQGDVVGSNNGCIGGRADWSKTILRGTNFTNGSAILMDNNHPRPLKVFIVNYIGVLDDKCTIQ